MCAADAAPLIPIRSAVTPDLDTPLHQILPAPSRALSYLFETYHMVYLWQPWMFTPNELDAMHFTREDLAWCTIIAERTHVPLGMVVGTNPLLAVPGLHLLPSGPEQHRWIYDAQIWQLIPLRHHIARREIDKLLAPTPYRVGMTATQLFISSGP